MLDTMCHRALLWSRAQTTDLPCHWARALLLVCAFWGMQARNCCHKLSLALSEVFVVQFPTHLDELHQRVAGALHGDGALDHLLAHVQVDLAGGAADVAEVRVRHLAGAVHDAPHDRDGHACRARPEEGEGLGDDRTTRPQPQQPTVRPYSYAVCS